MRKKNVQRAVAPVLHIFCEGSATEPNYLARYKDLFCRNKTAIQIEPNDKTTPIQLVEIAVQMKNSAQSRPDDEFWVVYDRESPVRTPEKTHQKARDLAQKNGIHIALSNVCFEVWLLMHFQATCAACNTCADLTGRDDFKKWFPKYEKGAGCTLTREQIETARKNALRMNARTITGADRSWTVPSKWNPYTNMHELLDAIDLFQKGD